MRSGKQRADKEGYKINKIKSVYGYNYEQQPAYSSGGNSQKKDVQKESQKQPKPFETNGMKVDFYDILRNIIILFTYTFEPNSLLTLKVSIL